MAMAAKMPMIATTIINSMRVKPFCTCLSMNAPKTLIKNRQTTACASARDRAIGVPEPGAVD
jgi:hypothetical protein